MVENRKQARESTPTAFPQSEPRIGLPGHDFTLQAVIEMQRSLGDLSAKVDRLINDTKSHGEKIDSVRMKFAWVAGGTAAVGFVIAMTLASLRFLPITDK